MIIYLETADGGCRKAEEHLGRLTEFPFTTNLVMECARSGDHPHQGTKGTMMFAIKPDMSDPGELSSAQTA